MIVLFDIDGTLVSGSHCGSRALARAFLELYGIEDALATVVVHGNLDPHIVRQVGQERGLWPETAPEQRAFVARVLSRYRDIFDATVGSLPYSALPGAAHVVLAARGASALVGLCTGNIQPCAHGKLRSAGLGELFEGVVAGYGDEAPTRGQVVTLAVERARAAGATGPALVVGDTPADVKAAREAGARSAAVATGRYSAEELRHAGADRVYADLRGLLAEAPWTMAEQPERI